MYCKLHPNEQVKFINVADLYEGDRLACLECLVELSDKTKSNYIRINDLLQDPKILLNSDHFKCNIALNLKHIHEHNLVKVLQYLSSIQLKLKIRLMKQWINQSIKQINLCNLSYLNSPKYMETCTQSIEVILQQINWDNLKVALEHNIKQEEQININAEIKQFINKFKSFEITDQYNELNTNLVNLYEHSKQSIQQGVVDTIEQITSAIDHISHEIHANYRIRYLSSLEEKLRLQQEEQQKKVQEQQRLQFLKWGQLQLQLDKFNNEQHQPYQESEQNFANKFNMLFQLTSHQQLSTILQKCIISEFVTPPQIQILKYSKHHYPYFGDKLKELQLLGNKPYMVLVETSRHLAGCYYPARSQQQQTLLFASDSDRHEIVPNFGQQPSGLKLRIQDHNVYEIHLRQGEFEFKNHRVMNCWFCAKHTDEQIKYMSIITFNR